MGEIMTDKQIINLKPMEDLNKKIIKEKGNTKCIFYSDDCCRYRSRCLLLYAF